MNLTYVLLSPTFGMHQYTADLANRATAAGNWKLETETVRLITTTTLPRDRYSPAVQIMAPLTTHGTGFSREGLDAAAYRRTAATVLSAALAQTAGHLPLTTVHCPLSTVHFTGVHAWNLPLLHALRRRGVPVIQTLHDLDPHTGVRFGVLIRLWNRLIIASGCHILVHARRYRDQLLAAGVPAERITCAPLLHGFLSGQQPWPPQGADSRGQETGGRGQESGARRQRPGDGETPQLPLAAPSAISHQPSAIPDSTFQIPDSPFTALFFGRVEAYKGADTLLAAWETLNAGARVNWCNSWQDVRLFIAGPVAKDVVLPPLPPGVELRDRRILDAEADALFRSASLLVLPYRDASQSALVAAAYAYGRPAIVTATGALPEYVVEGETGWIVPPDDPAALAAALAEALADPDRLRRMGAAGRAWFAARRAEEEAALAAMYQAVSSAGPRSWASPRSSPETGGEP